MEKFKVTAGASTAPPLKRVLELNLFNLQRAIGEPGGEAKVTPAVKEIVREVTPQDYELLKNTYTNGFSFMFAGEKYHVEKTEVTLDLCYSLGVESSETLVIAAVSDSIKKAREKEAEKF
ncbi:MAG: hypothetical protein ACRDCE_17270 [Cetobacterium sp.]|uniref:hypothetical protein n=1 Tax=Cetobacterium sp. TaxID=2071632 RepID=UPI003EE63930